MSRFGYLRTPLPPDASSAAQADAHACLLDALALPKAAVLGGSAGAPSAIQFCLRHAARCSAMVLLVPALFPGPRAGVPPVKPPAPPSPILNSILGSDFFFWLNVKLARDTMLERLFATPSRDFHAAPADEQERLLAAMRNALPMGPRLKGLWNDVAIVASGERYELERLSAPTLVIGVENDLFGIYESARQAVRRIPGARLVSFPTGGHLWVGHHRELMLELRSFLSGLQNREPRPREATVQEKRNLESDPERDRNRPVEAQLAFLVARHSRCRRCLIARRVRAQPTSDMKRRSEGNVRAQIESIADLRAPLNRSGFPVTPGREARALVVDPVPGRLER
jgi:pimeloyl-ACP methyl ester carboxylesterase